MKNRKYLHGEIIRKNTCLCVGLDTDLSRIPAAYLKAEDPIFEFNRDIIDATRDLCIAYKPNLAFYEAHGLAGWRSLERTLAHIPSEHLIIADAKRGDIGNTSKLYAKAFFEQLGADAVTVAPYMGEDSITPFLGYPGKWVIVLGLTSNPGAHDFQLEALADGTSCFERVIRKCQQWASPDELMFVVGATRSEQLRQVRALAPDHFFLVPGVGAQGGSYTEVLQQASNSHTGLIINSSREILYASAGADAMDKAREAAKKYQFS
jgi:orotidine-5'-phosphate decarboxylase